MQELKLICIFSLKSRKDDLKVFFIIDIKFMFYFFIFYRNEGAYVNSTFENSFIISMALFCCNMLIICSVEFMKFKHWCSHSGISVRTNASVLDDIQM